MKQLRLEVNTQGRDFVMGDLHGCYDFLLVFLEEVKFDKTKDRLISVGDLIDRGPKNLECLHLIYEPWFFAVQGNHEELMLAYLNGEPLGNWWFRNGGNWYFEVGMPLVHDIAKDVANLPHLITVDMINDKKFHVLHAELNWPEKLTDEDLETRLEEIGTNYCMNGNSITWSREIFGAQFMAEPLVKDFPNTKCFGPRLSHIYSGHTPVVNPLRIKGQTNLDTGAFFAYKGIPIKGAGLTFCEPLTGDAWTVDLEGCRSVKIVDYFLT